MKLSTLTIGQLLRGVGLLALTTVILSACGKEVISPPRHAEGSFLSLCTCVYPYIEDIELDTCVFDIRETDFVPINGNAMMRRMKPGEQLVVFSPYEIGTPNTWEPTDTLIKSAYPELPETGWAATFDVSSIFYYGDQYFRWHYVRNTHPDQEYMKGIRNLNSYGHALEFIEGGRSTMTPYWNHEPQDGWKIHYVGYSEGHWAADTIITPTFYFAELTVVGDTTRGILGIQNGYSFDLTDHDTSRTLLRMKMFDPPARLRNDEW